MPYIALLLSLVCLAAHATAQSEAEERAEYEAFGGVLKRPNTQKGRVVLVNCQKKLPLDALAVSAALFEKEVQFGVEVEEGVFDFPSPAIHGEASLFVVDDPKLPTLLVAPENRWALVNVSALGGNGEVFRSRSKKEIARAFGLLGGAFQSTFKQTLMSNITAPAQLDAFRDDRLPFDTCTNIGRYLKGYGLQPFKTAYYSEACEEGWAPPPKDEIQKGIAAEIKAELEKKKAR